MTGALEHLFGAELAPAFHVPSLTDTPNRSYSSTAVLEARKRRLA